MYIKLKNGQVDKYPYSIGQLRADNPNTSFPENITNETLAEFAVYPVNEVQQPDYHYTKNITEETPNIVNGEWYQAWKVEDASEEEIAKRKAEIDADAELMRLNDYRNESDPLFFKWQRGEIYKQVWLDKVAEIKARYA